MGSEVTLNGRRLQAAVVPVNPRFKQSDVARYLASNHDGLDAISVRARGDYLVIGQGLPAIKNGDRLKVDGEEAKLTFQENEINSFTEAAHATISSTTGGVALLSGGVIGAGAAWALALAGYVGFSAAISMLGLAVVGGLIGVGIVGLLGGLMRGRPKTDLSVTDRLK